MGTQADDRPLNTYAIAAFVYVVRDNKVLILKRAGGAGTGLWAPPGGAREHGESPVVAAERELLEETGLVATTPLDLIAVAPLQGIYGMDWLHCFYACECEVGEVVLNEEHSSYRWMDPAEYREKSFPDSIVDALASRPDDLANTLAFRDAFDRFIEWLDHWARCNAPAVQRT